MDTYSELKFPDLQALAKNRGLPASGSAVDLIARLEQQDMENDLLGDETPPDAPSAPPVAPEAAAAPEPEPEPEERPRVLYFKYPCHSELSTGVHLDNLRRARDEAEAQGYGTRGSERIGFENINGVRHAVYVVTLRR